MFVPFHDGVVSQFEGYEALKELDWDGYRARYDDLQRLDRILEAENDSVNNYKASKQADALMLFYLLSADELYELFNRLGYQFTPDQIPKTIDYYQSRTSHGSTLSAVVHAWVLAAATGTGRCNISNKRCPPTSSIFSEARPLKASTWRRWPAASTCCSGASPVWRYAAIG